jgi:hypothetical protein
MGSGVARQCSRNRCLARWTIWMPIVAREAGQIMRTRRKTWSRPNPRFLCPTPSFAGDRSKLTRTGASPACL